MNPATDLPHKYYLNLDRRTDRRVRCEAIFAEMGWEVTREAAVDAQRLKSARWFTTPGRYAHSVSTRLILRRAALAGAEAVLILEDDVVFSPILEQRLAELELPDDWGILYLGCQHCERPEIVAPGLVRVTAALDTHAWIVRREYFLEVRRAMRGGDWPKDGSPIPAADILLANLTLKVPAYATWPNLAWQEEDISDLSGFKKVGGNYDHHGRQKYNRASVTGLLAEMFGGKTHAPALEAGRAVRAEFRRPPGQTAPVKVDLETPVPPLGEEERVAFLFLTRGAHHHPDMWTEYWRGLENRVSVYGHAKERSWPARPGERDWLQEAQIGEHVPTEWGDVSLLYAELALLRAALADGRNRFFIFASETCVPVRPLRDLLHMLSLDGRCRMQVVPLILMEELGLTPHKVERAPVDGPLPPEEWLFHSQWLLLNREAVELIVANEVLLKCFEGVHAPDEAALCTILSVAGWPVGAKTVSQSTTWTLWVDDVVSHPELFVTVEPALMGEIMGSGCFFARKFAAGSGVAKFHPHV